jgi:hypothetical protein
MDLISSRPDVFKEDILTFLTLTNGFLIEIDIDGTGKGISHHEGR